MLLYAELLASNGHGRASFVVCASIMGRSLRIALLLGFSLGLFGVAPHDDGRPKDVRAVRSAAQTLLRSRIRRWGGDPSQITVDGVAVNGAYALAHWSAGNLSGTDGFYYIWDRWWDVMASATGNSKSARWNCSTPAACGSISPVADGYQAFKGAGFPQPLVEKAVDAGIVADDRSTKYPFWSGEMYPVRISVGPGGAKASVDKDGYSATFAFAATDAASDHPIVLSTRRPAQQESWTYYPGGNAYAFFTVQLDSAAPINVRAGSTVEVWCPFVLDPSKTYSLTIAKSAQPIGPVPGKLEDNVLHFDLPAFTAPADAELMGEIDGTL